MKDKVLHVQKRGLLVAYSLYFCGKMPQLKGNEKRRMMIS